LSLPYIDQLLKQLARGNPALEQSFGRHIHWGYWPDPGTARIDSPEDYGAAAERLGLELLAMADIRPGMRVLDAGCGFGGTLASLREKVAGLDLVGLNIDARQLQRAAALAREGSGAPPSFVAADACTLPFADASFDRVLAVECIFHFPSRAAFLAEVRRVLRPGGVLVLSDFVPASAWVPMVRLGMRLGADRVPLFGACDVSCSAAGYRRLADQTGLALAALRDITRHTLPTYAFLGRMLGQGAGSRRAWFARQAGPKLLELIGRAGLLRYGLLRFERA
jgi:SAM-dependent methyltransferase